MKFVFFCVCLLDEYGYGGHVVVSEHVLSERKRNERM